MKKIISILTVLVLLLALVACNGEEPAKTKNYQFQKGNVTVSIDAEAKAVLDGLGQWKDYSESPSCAFEALDKIYVYSGFRIETYTKGGVDYIRSVELTDDSVSTPEGIAIGSSKDGVIAAYGEADNATDTALTYENTEKGMKLQFLLRDGKVTNIQYLKIVE